MPITAAKSDTSSRIANSSSSKTSKSQDYWLEPNLDKGTPDIDDTYAPTDSRDLNKAAAAQSIKRGENNSHIVAKLPPIPVSDRKIQLLQQWECTIHRVNSQTVECEMHDLTDESQPPEFAEIYLAEFNEFDVPILAEGIVFYWSVGRETKPTGQVKRYSELRVRRIPRLNKRRKEEITRRARHLSKILHSQSK